MATKKISWDELLPDDLLKQWGAYHTELPQLQAISIPRWIGKGTDTLHCEVHGFSDASSSAYGASVYLRIQTLDGSVRSSLLVAKSRVVPLKPMSIPRLELTAALLLTRCIAFVIDALSLENIPCHCWTDSTVTLAWIQQAPSRWKPFVANRVYAIQTQLQHALWHYVPSAHNPADLASRGMNASALATLSLWWQGPDWLQLSSDQWPNDTGATPSSSLLEARTQTSHLASINPEWDLSYRYSSWPKLLRITAYLLRFINRCRHSGPPSSDRLSLSLALNAVEITQSRLYWLTQIQSQLFPDDQCHLNTQCPLSPKSQLRSLHPFLDENGLIRIGGRLRHSDLPEKTKNPIVLVSHPLVKLLIRHIHIRALHAGPTLTLHLLREDYWLLKARQVVRAVIHECVECVRQRGETAVELMGDLPQFRVCPSLRAFIHCGVDYVGPFQICYAPGRGRNSYKAYVTVFIRMVTRALHLDLVSDYTTSAFLAAYKRFCSRRGIPSGIYSDNAKNFRGAQRKLALAWREVTKDANLLTALAEDEVNWHFISPSTPHFGGLWESRASSITYEEW